MNGLKVYVGPCTLPVQGQNKVLLLLKKTIQGTCLLTQVLGFAIYSKKRHKKWNDQLASSLA